MRQSPALRLNDTLASRDIALRRLRAIAAEVATGRIVPYLGPRVLDVGPPTAVPSTPARLAMALYERAPVGAALRGSMWSTAQAIEQRRHRTSLVAFMAEIFTTPLQPGPLHHWLATLAIPLIVDTWYDDALVRSLKLAGRTDFVEIQGVTRGLEAHTVWTKAYGLDGREVDGAAMTRARTVIYKPHGSVAPAQNFLVADSDYLEVLIEIDIQTPVPEAVKDRRTGRGFIFIGCRFDDQILRTYARQIMKRSGGPRYIVLDFEPTRMEERFLAEQGIEPIACGLADAINALVAA